MTIKFFRPYEQHEAGDVVTLDESQEYMLVSQNYANYCEKPDQKPKKVAKPKKDANK